MGKKMWRTSVWMMFICGMGLFLLSPVRIAFAEDPWWPVKVNSYYGQYDAKLKKPGLPSKSLKGPKQEEWSPPEKANKPYMIGVSFPHLKDSYWIAVNYGIISEAKRLGVGVHLLEAGGYDNLTKQTEQLLELVQEGVDGIILGAISYTALDTSVSDIVKKGLPVVEVINDIQAQDITAKALVSFFDMGYCAGEFVAHDAKASGKEEINVVFLPGPQDSGWAPETLEGFKTAGYIFPGKINILSVKWGDTGKEVQSALIKEILESHSQIDYIVGNAVAADAAPDLLKETERDKSIKVVSTYIIPTLYDKIRSGSVAAAPSDLSMTQGRIAVNMMVRILNGEKAGEGFPFRAGPIIPTITKENIDRYPYEMLFGPRDFKPEFKLEPKK